MMTMIKKLMKLKNRKPISFVLGDSLPQRSAFDNDDDTDDNDNDDDDNDDNENNDDDNDDNDEQLRNLSLSSSVIPSLKALLPCE